MLNGCGVKPAATEVSLLDGWQFKKSTDTSWGNATVPGTVHTDLIAIGSIEDPFYRLNEHDVQWIDKENWEYQTTFKVSGDQLSKEHIEMEFLGLDTYATVFVNGEQVLKSDNMFRTYEIDVKKILKIGDNKLRVVFDSPIKRGIEKYDAQGYNIPVSDNDLAAIGQVEEGKQVSIYTRKAGYHFGWDWGPRLVSSGIWRPINLKSWNSHQIEDVFIKQNKLDKKAALTAMIEVEATEGIAETVVEIFVDDQLVKKENLSLQAGKNELKIPFEIENPELWWPNGMGEQPLYQVKVKVTGNSYADQQSKRIGLRTVELIMDPDSIGTSFYFKVNGKPVFMKGANYIPQDVFLPRAGKANYEHILASAKAANMNMLRVWGGGIYENDEFYDLCDEMGLLVWQDFMFACAMFPGDSAFLENVKQEAIDNVKRLRNHSSIALWCGNNEILSAWENWGWKNNVIKDQSQEVADSIWKAYDDVFHKILPEVVNELDDNRSYWPSSPGSAFGEKESFDKGDAHYWMVWWGKRPFDNYNEAIPRFMSEFGFQSFPAFSSIEKYTQPEDHDIYSEVMKSHQRSSIGNGTIEEYMLRHYREPKDFPSFIYVSQLLQAHGIQIGIEAHRKNMKDFRCMGSLYWQINDCWPVASWSSIDYFGKWKAVHYAAKKSFENVMVAYEDLEDHIKVHIVSDSLESLEGELKIDLIDFDGNIVKEWRKDVNVAANDADSYFGIAKDSFTNEISTKNVFLYTKLIVDEKILTDKIMYLSPFKEIDFPEPGLSYEIKEVADEFVLELKTERLAKSVFLESRSTHNFSDNYFDIVPQGNKTVIIKKQHGETLNDFKSQLIIRTLDSSYGKSAAVAQVVK